MSDSVSFTAKFEVTAEQLENLFECARQNYWVCAWFDEDGEEQPNPIIGDRYDVPESYFDDVDNGFSNLRANASKGFYALTTAKIQRGLRLLAVEYPEHFAWVMNDNSDADTGDFFLQLALFGKVVYG